MSDLISRKALIEWLTSHFDLELDEPLEKEMIRLINDQDAVQPQGIDKDRLIEEITKIADRYCDSIKCEMPCIEDETYICDHANIIGAILDFINQQPTTDSWIPVSEQPPKEPCVYTVEDYSPYTVAKYGEPQRKFLKTLPLGLEMYERIVAWKPVEPQPYKEEK